MDFEATSGQLENGGNLFGQYCAQCHGGGIIPELTYSRPEIFESFQSIVGEGAYLSLGMPSFKDRLTEQEIENIKNFIFSEAKVMRENLNP